MFFRNCFTSTAVILSLIFPQAARSVGNEPCPIIGAYYPVPTTLGSSKHVNNATTNSKAQIQEALENGTFDANTTSLSIEVYSLHDETPLLTFHHTPKILRCQRTTGVETVDSNTVYRVGSVSKLWTAYLYLITAGDSSWARPVTDFVPELAAIAQARKASDNEIDNVSWETITVGALASHLAGIGRDASWSATLADKLESLGLPDQGGNSDSTCGDLDREMTPCNRTGKYTMSRNIAFFEDFPRQHPVAGPFQTPAYSNAGYQILAYVLQNITGLPLSDHFQKYLVESLGLNGTYYNTPSATNISIIPYNTTYSWWDFDFLDKTPAAGYYSTAHDMSVIGKAILNSTWLSPTQTRRWMKPHAFTSNPNFAVGAPWEIIRAPGTPVSWIYAKSGDAGLYSGMTMLMPDLDVGMSILAAGKQSTEQVLAASDLLAANFVPAFWAEAKEQTTATYAGTYTNDDINSTIFVTEADNAPGLVISEFILGGQDVLQILSFYLETNMTLRLYHMGLTAVGDNGTVTDSWRAIFETPAALPSSPSSSCVSWLFINPLVYGGIGLDEFLFTLDSTGRNALAIESRIVGIGVPKTGSMQSRTILKKV